MRYVNIERTARRSVSAFATAIALASAVATTQAQDQITPPSVPANIVVPEGNRPFLAGHAVGTQNYICLPSGTKVAWSFLGPQATLFDDAGEQIVTHFLSPNPFESGAARPTWQHSRDTSAVWAQRRDGSSDPEFVEAGAIPWLLLETVGAQDGPTGGARLSATTFIQRVNTTGGSAPQTGCKVQKDLYKVVFVPYTSDYFFYQSVGSGQ